MDAHTYCKERLDQQLDWLSHRSQIHKAAFFRFRFVAIVLGALVTILSPYAGRRDTAFHGWIPPLLQLAGAGVAISGALLALNSHQEHWLRYRSLKEALVREKFLFLTASTEAYAAPDAFHQFVRTAEDLMGSERTLWLHQAGESANQKQGRSASTAATADSGSVDGSVGSSAGSPFPSAPCDRVPVGAQMG